MNAIELRGLGKTFGTTAALEPTSFALPPGTVFGFLGPNGAGKTTTVRLLNGILAPTAGLAWLNGQAVSPDNLELHRFCGLMTENAGLYENLPARDNLVFFGRLHGQKAPEANQRAAELLDLLGLADTGTKKVASFSTGMKKRLSLARALMHRPSILFLDEPTSGLDPEAAQAVTFLIRDLARKDGVTVFLCTHQLKYAEDICDLYGFLHQGRLVGFGTFSELIANRQGAIRLEVRGAALPERPNATRLAADRLMFNIKGDEDVPAILSDLSQGGARIYEARQLHWSLEELYFSFIEKARSQEVSHAE